MMVEAAIRAGQGGKVRDNIRLELKRHVSATQSLHRQCTAKRFTLDGRLVGDISEVLAEQYYDLELLPSLQRHYDATRGDGKRIQNKTTMKDALTFPADHVPDHYLGLKLSEDGTISEVFNGPGRLIAEYLGRRKPPKTNFHIVSLSALRTLQETVKAKSVAKRG
jgi:hypothetical protein